MRTFLKALLLVGFGAIQVLEVAPSASAATGSRLPNRAASALGKRAYSPCPTANIASAELRIIITELLEVAPTARFEFFSNLPREAAPIVHAD